MRLLNLGAGSVRPATPWLNVDGLVAQLTERADGGPALAGLLAEPNYLDYDLAQTPWPWPDASIDGILASHFFEHFDTQDALRMMKECRRVLVPGGVLRVSVPDAAYFRQVHADDCRENWMQLFGEGNDVSANETYMAVALFYVQHLQTYTEDALWCQLAEAGFTDVAIRRVGATETAAGTEAARMTAALDNRVRFSLFMEAVKSG